jgi:hypothetical protein
MQGFPHPTPPPWIEGDSIRETTLQLLDDPEDREAVRRAGRVLYDLAVVVTREVGMTPADRSVASAELRAVAADLRYTGGYLLHVIRSSAESCSLDAEEEALARFAGKLSRQVAALVEKIERRLS